MDVREMMRRFLPVARDRPPVSRAIERKIVLANYYDALQSSGNFSGYRSRPWPVERAVSEAYERIVWVYKSVESISSHASQLPFVLKDGEKVVEDHPLVRVMNKKANPLETGRQFRKRLSAQILLSKRGAFVEVTKSRGGDIVRLDLLPPGRTWPIPGTGEELISHYEVIAADGSIRTIEVENVRWFRDPHPLDAFSGVTPLEAAGLSIELDFFTRMYNVSFLKNDARPGGVLAISGEMDPDEMDRVEDRFAKGPVEAGKLTVVSGDVSYVDLAAHPRDMSYETTATIAKKEILTAFGVPESVIGDASGRTWDNAEQELYNYWTITMPPHLGLVLTGLDEDSADELEGHFDTEEVEVLQRPKRARREEARAEVEAGLISIDEYRELAGYDPVDNEYTRSLYIAQAKQPLPTSDKDAEKLGLTAPPDQNAVQAPGQGIQPGQDQGQGPAQPPAQPPGTPPQVAQKPAPPAGPGAPTGQPQKPAQPVQKPVAAAAKHLTALPDAAPPPAEIARPVMRLVRPAPETKAAETTTESSPSLADRDKLQAALAATLSALAVRLTARAATRLASPKSRKGTRHWTAQYDTDHRIGTKEIDAESAVDVQRWQDETEQAAHPLVEAAAVAAGNAMLLDIGAPPMPDLSGVVAPVVSAVVRLLGALAAEQATKLVGLIRDGEAAGTTIDVLTTTVRGFAKQMATWADAVSVSAATATVNGARDLTSQAWVDEAPGRDIVRVWRTRGDGQVRPSHREAGGQTRPLGESFQVGQSWLRYPGDPDAPIHETANCRCWLMHRSTMTGQFVGTPPGQVTRAPKQKAAS